VENFLKIKDTNQMFNYIYKHIFKDFGVGFPIQNKGTSKFKNGGIGEKKSRLLNVKGA
jgi:hypothetical protein